MKMIRSALNERSATLYEQFACLCVACLQAERGQAGRQAEADRLDLPSEATAQAGATIKRNFEVLGYGG